MFSTRQKKKPHCGVEVWRGGLGGAYLLPTLSSVGASLAPPCFRFHTPLIEPDVRICRISRCGPPPFHGPPGNGVNQDLVLPDGFSVTRNATKTRNGQFSGPQRTPFRVS